MADLATSEPTGRDRLLTALRRPSRGQLLAGLLLGLVGFAAVVQVQANERSDRYAGATQADLIALINSQELQQQRVEAQISSLEQTKSTLQNDAAASDAATQLAKERAASLAILAGTVGAVGPGVTITLDGPAGSIGTEVLVNGIQELRSAGAEAIEINRKVRVIGQSSFQPGSDDSVLVDGVRLKPPYTLKVIGSPSGLEQAVNFPEGFRADVEDAGGTFDVRQASRVEIDSVRESQPPRYAHTVPAG